MTDPPAAAPSPAKPPIPRSRPFPWVVFVAVVVFAAGGWFIVDRMSDVGNVQDCVMSGRKNCVPIDPRTGK
jgi:hypothetical protein